MISEMKSYGCIFMQKNKKFFIQLVKHPSSDSISERKKIFEEIFISTL